MRAQNWFFLIEQLGGVSTQYFDGHCAQRNRGGGKEETYLSYWAEEVKKWAPSMD